MEQKVETGNSALLTRAIPNPTVYLDTDNQFVRKIHITSGMFLS